MEATMFCPQCGTTNDDTATSCSACGYDLGKYRQQWDADGGAVASTDTVAASAAPSDDAIAPDQPAPAYGHTPPPDPRQYQQSGYQGPSYQSPRYPGPPYQQQPYQQQPYAGYYTNPPYQPNPYGQAPYGMRPHVPSYLGWAIAVLILCFWPTGIAAVVFASQVDGRLISGDYYGAQESSRKAKMWCWISFGIAIGIWVLAIAAFVILAIVGASIKTMTY
jgi:hypothetical protein